jgi:thiol-disulfide isomerase/thioredoxin
VSDRVIKKPQVLFFYASWCGPSQSFRKVLDRALNVPTEAASVPYSEFYLPMQCYEVDECKEWLLSQHRVLGTPTTVLLSRHEKEIARLVGYNSLESTKRFLQRGLH